MITGSTVAVTAQAVMAPLGTLLTAAALGYALVAWLASRLWRNGGAKRRLGSSAGVSPAQPLPVTVLKPLCGAEPGLDHSLRSFCEQDYAGGVQIVFGVQHAADPALAVLEGLKRDYPRLDLTVVVDSTRHGASAKVSNLINMMRAARHDWLVLADSDVCVPPGYLAAVTAPLADPTVGIVTCPYRGIPRPGLWSLLGALFINDWFIPSVRVAALFGSRAFAFGATIALRRDALDAIGGFGAIADQLADDYRLGELTRRRGQRTVLSDVVVDTSVDERTFRHLAQHGLRWLRTIRVVRPAGYASSVVTFSLPVAVIGCALAGGTPVTVALLAATAVLRLLLHSSAQSSARSWSQFWAIPLADILGFALWCTAFVTREVQWRQGRYRVAR
ncbi:MAG TPA: bacteriohopanetetrol glucosamine biosynthesis glycosyltransferase HpnI, partial [Steroidobacteraceae bacterium]|nr:bacteriohopanetetrol glucosamine biosynthesis glycosyltransferase HpnI [Steroidobacteraceae bacterium]